MKGFTSNQLKFFKALNKMSYNYTIGFIFTIKLFLNLNVFLSAGEIEDEIVLFSNLSSLVFSLNSKSKLSISFFSSFLSSHTSLNVILKEAFG